MDFVNTILWVQWFNWFLVYFTVCSSSSPLSAYFWRSYGRECWKPSLSQIGYLFLSPHLPSWMFHHRRLSSCSSIATPWRSHADYSWWLSCPSCAWKWLPWLIISSLFQRLRWSWSSLGPLSRPFWRQEWHLLSCSPQAPLPAAMIFQRLLRVILQWHQAAPLCSDRKFN